MYIVCINKIAVKFPQTFGFITGYENIEKPNLTYVK